MKPLSSCQEKCTNTLSGYGLWKILTVRWNMCATTPKNVLCVTSHEKVYCPFFFFQARVTGNSYLDMLQLWFLPRLEQDIEDLIFQQDGPQHHYHLNVRNELNTRFPRRRAGREDFESLPWPPCSPDLTPRDFFSGVL